MQYNTKILLHLKENRMTQKTLSEKTGIRQATLSQIITGRIDPSEKEKTAISLVLKKSRKYLFDA